MLVHSITEIALNRSISWSNKKFKKKKYPKIIFTIFSIYLKKKKKKRISIYRFIFKTNKEITLITQLIYIG